MKEDKVKFAKIESELFALINSIINLYNKYQKGSINENFFQKAIKDAMNGLLNINLYLKESNISLTKFLNGMNLLNDYNKAIKIVNNISDLDSYNESNAVRNGNKFYSEKRIRSSILELPGIASEITSAFITLIDALKLEGQSQYLIIRLLNELKANFKKFKFPGLTDIQLKIKKIYKDALKNTANLISDNQFREEIADRLYSVLKEFQQKISVKT
jgi:hypothetical protein